MKLDEYARQFDASLNRTKCGVARPLHPCFPQLTSCADERKVASNSRLRNLMCSWRSSQRPDLAQGKYAELYT